MTFLPPSFLNTSVVTEWMRSNLSNKDQFEFLKENIAQKQVLNDQTA